MIDIICDCGYREDLTDEKLLDLVKRSKDATCILYTVSVFWTCPNCNRKSAIKLCISGVEFVG